MYMYMYANYMYMYANYMYMYANYVYSHVHVHVRIVITSLNHTGDMMDLRNFTIM